jgi:hypothetical protein
MPGIRYPGCGFKCASRQLVQPGRIIGNLKFHDVIIFTLISVYFLSKQFSFARENIFCSQEGSKPCLLASLSTYRYLGIIINQVSMENASGAVNPAQCNPVTYPILYFGAL